MLSQITISQFTVVEYLEVDFRDGLTVVTGETGAGKSIMLDALGLCLGDRADPSAIRPGEDRADISARFEIDSMPAAQKWLEAHDLAADGDCLFRRVITREGRSRAYINGRPSTLQDCAALGELLVDIHGQHAHQSLLRRPHQRMLLDSYAGQLSTAQKVSSSASEWLRLRDELDAVRSNQQEQADREQLLRYQVGELDELALGDTELQSLEDEQRVLENADAIQRQAAGAIELCDSNESGVRAALAALDQDLHQGKTITNVREMLDSAAIQLAEARSELQQYLAGTENNPQRLAEVEARLEAIYALARKHRIMPEQLSAHHQALSEELATLDSSDERIEAMEAALAQQFDAYKNLAGTLSGARKKAATKLEKEVSKLLKKLSMSNCQFKIALGKREGHDPHLLGEEDIELLISTNPGAAPQPLGRIASGGELSRISLAIQVATAGNTTVPSMVFDEVDVGIGGAVAEVVGRLLADMGRNAQVLCVTHLPQVAAQGQQHLQVEKSGKGKRLASTLHELDENERVNEIARMLGGLKMTENTLAHAREMLESRD
ncbi:DNA repair protein RecN [Congregibacter litoralis]|uniref:DNA repair protein RecN n=1 Tax=Congregibacter litoralis KT71 TaxID=314285 RepID=A4A5R7_9GAMM|nr:DNA repair protein RecN [Congregibacter litoralis]EAQ98364.1 DNA replication and repair protein RecN [Congregibacter litoralis KT71]